MFDFADLLISISMGIWASGETQDVQNKHTKMQNLYMRPFSYPDEIINSISLQYSITICCACVNWMRHAASDLDYCIDCEKNVYCELRFFVVVVATWTRYGPTGLFRLQSWFQWIFEFVILVDIENRRQLMWTKIEFDILHLETVLTLHWISRYRYVL